MEQPSPVERTTGALRYAELGWPVYAAWWVVKDGKCACGDADCGSPGKHPLGVAVPRGHLDATTDAPITVLFYDALNENHITPGAATMFDLFTENPWIYEGVSYFCEPLTAANFGGRKPRHPRDEKTDRRRRGQGKRSHQGDG